MLYNFGYQHGPSLLANIYNCTIFGYTAKWNRLLELLIKTLLMKLLVKMSVLVKMLVLAKILKK